MNNKRNYIGKFYVKDFLSEIDEHIFLCDVYCEEDDNSKKFYTQLNDKRFEVHTICNNSFRLYIDDEHQYSLISEETIIT